MNYLDDLDDNITKAEELVEELIKARANGWDTVLDLCENSLSVLLKSIKHCINCANRQRAKKDTFKCTGGCVRAGAFDNFKERNRGIWYVQHWTQRGNNEQMPDEGM